MARFYECKVMVKVPDEASGDWSEHTDETMHLANCTNSIGDATSPLTSVHLVDYKEIKEQTFLKHRYDTFTPEGGV